MTSMLDHPLTDQCSVKYVMNPRFRTLNFQPAVLNDNEAELIFYRTWVLAIPTAQAVNSHTNSLLQIVHMTGVLVKLLYNLLTCSL